MARRCTRVASFALSCCILATGCSTSPPKGPDLPPVLFARSGPPAKIAVVPAPYAPESNLAVFASDSGSGATKGAMGGAAAGAVVPLALVNHPLLIPLAIAAMPGTALIGLVVGAFSGARGATPPETAAAIERLITARLTDLRMSESTARIVVASIEKTGVLRGEVLAEDELTAAAVTPDYRPLAVRDFGAVIEVGVRRIAFTQARGTDPNLALIVTAEARLLDAVTGKPVTSRHFAYESPKYVSSLWAQDDGKLVGTEFARAQFVLGERIVETLLLGAEWSPISRAGSFGNVFIACGLPPTAPSPSVALFSRHLDERKIDSRWPTLAWEAFPLASWVESDKDLGKAENVRYDLRLWEASEKNFVGELVYERSDLPATNHRLENELKSGTQYFWSVRARYTVGGRPQATRWNAAQQPQYFSTPELKAAVAEPGTDRDVASPSCTARGLSDVVTWTPCRCLDFIPAANYYRFTTP